MRAAASSLPTSVIALSTLLIYRRHGRENGIKTREVEPERS